MSLSASIEDQRLPYIIRWEDLETFFPDCIIKRCPARYVFIQNINLANEAYAVFYS